MERGLLLQAQDLLEKGLLYPIDTQYAPKYLKLLANLRFENGDDIGAQQILEARLHMNTYRFDLSSLATTKNSHL